MWIQVADPNDHGRYESVTCAIKYNEEKGVNIGAHQIYSKGYTGVNRLQYATGNFEQLLSIDEVEYLPWKVNRPETGKTYVTQDPVAGNSETCSMFRDF